MIAGWVAKRHHCIVSSRARVSASAFKLYRRAIRLPYESGERVPKATLQAQSRDSLLAGC
jgi:hypothetical protein